MKNIHDILKNFGLEVPEDNQKEILLSLLK